MIKLNSDNFSQIDELKDIPYLIKFTSPTCGPCNTMKPVYEALERENTDFNFFEIDTGVSPELAALFEIRGVPTIHFCENRNILYSLTGITPLRDLKYIIENINDPYMREHGHFKPVKTKTDYRFPLIILIVLISLFAIFMLATK